MEGMRVEKLMSLRIFGSLDQFLRVVNILRRSSAEVRSLEAKFFGSEILALIRLEGRIEEIDWALKKVFTLPEVRSAEMIEAMRVAELKATG